MYVRMIGFGTNWWAMNSGDLGDPLCFRRKAAYFNATAILSGRRLHHSAIFPGQIRFNAKSGFDPEFRLRSIGKTYLCAEPREFRGKVHLLAERSAIGMKPDAYLVTLNSAVHGGIAFERPGWKSIEAKAISISVRGLRYEAMLLLPPEGWVKSDVGRWCVDVEKDQLVLAE